MNRRSRSITVASTWLVGSLLAGSAAADLPPPEGTRRVDFAIAVDNLAAFPDRVVLAYPWSLSNGTPTTEHARLEDGKPLEIGRRSGTPELWSASKADYDAFVATYKPTRSFQDEPLDAFFKSGKVVACKADIKREGTVPQGDPRDRIVQTFRAEAVDAKQCKLVAKTETGAKPSNESDGNGTKGGAAKDAPAKDGTAKDGPANDGAATPAEAAPPGKGGCAGCTTGAGAEKAAAGWAAFAVAAIGVAIAGRRKR